MKRRKHREPQRFVAPAIEGGQEPRKLQRAGVREQSRQIQELFPLQVGFFENRCRGNTNGYRLRRFQTAPQQIEQALVHARQAARESGQRIDTDIEWRRAVASDAQKRRVQIGRRVFGRRGRARNRDRAARDLELAAGERAHERRDPALKVTPSPASWPLR